MGRARTRTFKSGNSEAVRLPKDASYGLGVELEVVRSGDVTTLYPTQMSLAEIVRRLAQMPHPGPVEERDIEELPEPRGL